MQQEEKKKKKTLQAEAVILEVTSKEKTLRLSAVIPPSLGGAWGIAYDLGL